MGSGRHCRRCPHVGIIGGIRRLAPVLWFWTAGRQAAAERSHLAFERRPDGEGRRAHSERVSPRFRIGLRYRLRCPPP